MADLQGEQSKVYRAVETFGDLFILNLAFILFSIPIVTFGASATALYSVSLKMCTKEEGPIWRSFVDAFKKNFKKSTIVWLILIAIAAVIEVEYIYVSNFTGTIVTIYKGVIIVESLFLILVLVFIFPLLARYENTVFKSITNAALLSLGNLWPFLKMLVAWVMPVFLSFYNIGVFYATFYVWLIFMFALIAFGTSHTALKVFKKIEKTQADKKPQAQAIEDASDSNQSEGDDDNQPPKATSNNNRIKRDGSLSRHLYHK